ncbi:hypothetical protein D3C87_2077030 [compost metagenome]
MLHVSLGKRVFDEDGFHCLQVELRRQIHHGQIFIVKIAMLLSGIAVVLDEVQVEILVCRHVLVEVHRHEAG